MALFGLSCVSPYVVTDDDKKGKTGMNERDREALVRADVLLELAAEMLCRATVEVYSVDTGKSAQIDFTKIAVLRLKKSLKGIETEKLLD